MQSCCAINMSCLAFSVLCHAPSDALVLLVLVADEPALRVKTFSGVSMYDGPRNGLVSKVWIANLPGEIIHHPDPTGLPPTSLSHREPCYHVLSH